MADARFVKVEGLQGPCLIVCENESFPEEIVVDFDRAGPSGDTRRGTVTYRLQPSSVDQPEPVYVEIFDE